MLTLSRPTSTKEGDKKDLLSGGIGGEDHVEGMPGSEAIGAGSRPPKTLRLGDGVDDLGCDGPKKVRGFSGKHYPGLPQ